MDSDPSICRQENLSGSVVRMRDLDPDPYIIKSKKNLDFHMFSDFFF
jgi:hypothetical protein